MKSLRRESLTFERNLPTHSVESQEFLYHTQIFHIYSQNCNDLIIFFSIKAELSEIREKSNLSGGRYKQNQRFEEMRRLQDTLAIEKKDWFHRKEALEAEERDTKLRLAKDLVRKYNLKFVVHYCLNELLESQKLDKFYYLNFKLDEIQVRWFVF